MQLIKKYVYVILILLNSIVFADTQVCEEKILQIEKDANKGNELKQYIMGILYQNGICVEHNISKAIQWFSKSSKKNYYPAKYNLSDIYHFGNKIEKNNKKAIKLYQAILFNNNVEIKTRLGNIYLIGEGVDENLTIAKQLYLLAAEEDYIPALYNLGLMYLSGVGVKKDLEKAIEYFEKPAKNNHIKAQYYLAMALNELDENKNKNRVFDLLKGSAIGGFDEAQVVLGYGYILGKDVKKDMKKGRGWIIKAKDQNSTKAEKLWNEYELWKYEEK